MVKASNVIKKPIITEKSVKLAKNGKYTFEVNPDADKNQIRRAFNELYDIEIGKVCTHRTDVRRKRSWKMGGWKTEKVSSRVKRAIVEIREGKDKLSKIFKL